MAHFGDSFLDIIGAHDFLALREDDAALIIHHIIIFEQLLADLKIARLNLRLRLFNRLVDPGVNDGLPFLKT